MNSWWCIEKIELAELRRMAARLRIPQGTVEKDYVISVFLGGISESGFKDSLAFKGGTAIKKAYFRDARFSEDIDFTVINAKMGEVERMMGKIFKQGMLRDIELLALEREKTSSGLRLAVKFLGPIRFPQRVKLDFSFREQPLLPVAEREIFDDYGLGRHFVPTMALPEIMAEKLRAISSRTYPRDMYDIWYLHRKGVKIETGLADRKFSIYGGGEKFEKQKVLGALSGFRQNWKMDLQQFLKEVPPFEVVEKEITGILGGL